MIMVTPISAQRRANQRVHFVLDCRSQIAQRISKIMQGSLTDATLEESRVLMQEFCALSCEIRAMLPKVWFRPSNLHLTSEKRAALKRRMAELNIRMEELQLTLDSTAISAWAKLYHEREVVELQLGDDACSVLPVRPANHMPRKSYREGFPYSLRSMPVQFSHR